MEWISNEPLPWERLAGSTIVVTGSTGLIGMTAIHALIHASRKRGLGLHICAVIRDPEKAERVFGDLTGAPELTLLKGTMEDLPEVPQNTES